jgi:hypothetical protein
MTTETPSEPVIGDGQPAGEPWRVRKDGREYVPRLEGHGLIWREGDETVEQARQRDATAKPDDKKKAKTKPRRPAMPAASRKVDLRELEKELAEALKSPAMLCASFGDEWGADHFVKSGPYLARNLVAAAEHNPWLRKRLEQMATGQDAAMAIIAMVGVGGALFAYAAPPIIYYLNLPVSEKTREMFAIPPRREPKRAPEYATTPNGAPSTPTTEPAAPPAGP